MVIEALLQHQVAVPESQGKDFSELGALRTYGPNVRPGTMKCALLSISLEIFRQPTIVLPAVTSVASFLVVFIQAGLLVMFYSPQGRARFDCSFLHSLYLAVAFWIGVLRIDWGDF